MGKNLKLVEKASSAAAGTSVKWANFDEKYGVVDSVEATASSLVERVKGMDAKYGLSRRLSANERVQSVGSKVNATIQSAVKTIDDIGQETQQLVQEKRQHGIGLAANGEEGNMESQVGGQ